MSESYILIGDCREALRELPDESVHCVVTSPPYFGLRDYGTEPFIWGGDTDCEHGWRDHIQPAANGIVNGGMTGETMSGNSATRKPKRSAFCSRCNAWRGQLGLEPTPELFVAHMVEVFREVKRVLRDDGTLWLNIGDSYARSDKKGGSGFGGKNQAYLGDNYARACSDVPPGCKPKDLIGIPWMLAFALRADGWYLRSDIIWHKPNPMPESVRDRPTRSHENIFMLSKSQKYYYDAAAIAEPVAVSTVERISQPNLANQVGSSRANGGAKTNGNMKAVVAKQDGHGRRHAGFNEGYFESDYTPSLTRNKRDVWTITTKPFKGAHFATFPPDLIEPCILAGSPVGGVVLDPFFGAGTTGLVAQRLGRLWIGCELNEEYAQMAMGRISKRV